MQCRIENIETEKLLIGLHKTMSFSHNTTAELWHNFMVRKNEVANMVDTNLYSVQQYNSTFFQQFNPSAKFDKWAAVEVSNTSIIPNGMEIITLKGLYAVFMYKGDSSEGHKVFDYIFTKWLPDSDYLLDDRLHFEILGEKYRNNNPESEEEIWIPIKKKTI